MSAHRSLAGFYYGWVPTNPKTPRLYMEDYKTITVPTPVYGKPVDRYSYVPSFPMYLNDSLGDCTIAEEAHYLGAVSVASGETGGEVLFANSAIQTVYSAVSGYQPGNPNTDNGAEISQVLAYQQSQGITDLKNRVHKITAYAQIVNPNAATLNWALKNFGGVKLGINCPESAESQFSDHQNWSYVQGSPIAGGHCIGIQGNSEEGLYQSTTWGAVVNVEQDFFDHYLEEAWVVLSSDWLKANGSSVTGLDLDELQSDMNALKGLPE